MLDQVRGEHCALVADGNVDVLDVGADAVDAVGDQRRLEIGDHRLGQILGHRHQPVAAAGSHDHGVPDLPAHSSSAPGGLSMSERISSSLNRSALAEESPTLTGSATRWLNEIT